MIVPALIAKFLSAGAIAQAATGAGVVVVVVTGAGAANVLPDGAQETFSDLTGIHQTIDEAGDELADPVVKPVEGQPLDPADPALQAPVEGEADVTAFDVEAWGRGYDPDVYASFGAWVSLGAHNKADLAEFLAAHEYRNFGAMVSAEAHKKGVDDDELADELADEGLALEDLKDGEDGTDGERTETSDDSEAGASNAGDDSTSHGKSADKGNAGAKGQGHGDGQGHGGKN